MALISLERISVYIALNHCLVVHVFVLLSLEGILVHHWVTPSITFFSTHSYTCVERGTVSQSEVSCSRTQHNIPYQGLNPQRLIWSTPIFFAAIIPWNLHVRQLCYKISQNIKWLRLLLLYFLLNLISYLWRKTNRTWQMVYYEGIILDSRQGFQADKGFSHS